MAKPIKNVLFEDAIEKGFGKTPSSGDCIYVDTDLTGIPLVLGETLGESADLLNQLGKGK